MHQSLKNRFASALPPCSQKSRISSFMEQAVASGLLIASASSRRFQVDERGVEPDVRLRAE